MRFAQICLPGSWPPSAGLWTARKSRPSARPITCPPARTYLYLCWKRNSLPFCSPSIGNTLSSAFRNSWTLQMRPSGPLSVSIDLLGRDQNP
jgi:hypothetical protein